MRNQFPLIGALLLWMAGCGAAPEVPSPDDASNDGSGTAVFTPSPTPVTSGLDGLWVLVADLSPLDYRLDGACIEIYGGMVTGWYDGCGYVNNLITPATVFHDGTGPWFEILVPGMGSLVVYMEWIGYDLYATQLSTSFGDWYGLMERI